ncbi:MAG TPA: DEAD/DEAH box helicase [Planctomycetota bacterium]|nr:DEAD/DEAH box helicase [Planctomycetota bacterium]
MTLRDYQQAALDGIKEKLAAHWSTLIVLATGLGKTIIFAAAIGIQELRQGKRVLVLAHRQELIQQAAAKIEMVTGVTPEIEMADQWADRQGLWNRCPIIVSSVQTQVSGARGQRRMSRFNPHDFGLLIIDEAHHGCAQSYKEIVAYYRQNKELKVLGVTATPDRADEKALGQVFDSVAFVYGIEKGIDSGYLVPIHSRLVHVIGLDFSAVRTTAGDLNSADLAAVMEEEHALHEVAGPTYDIAGQRKTLIFASSVAHAERIAEILNRHEESCAMAVSAQTPREMRAEIFARYKRGDFRFLVNVGICIEGWDEPTVEVVVMARPTKSRSLYTQMIGRATRPCIGDAISTMKTAEERKAAIAASAKPHMEVVDFVGNSGRHSLISAADILGGDYSDDVVRRVKEEQVATASAQDIEKALAAMEEKIRREQEEAEKRKHVVAQARYRSTVTDPFSDFGIPAPAPNYRAHALTTAQIADVQKSFDLLNVENLTAAELSRLHGELIGRRRAGLCTPKQARRLKKYGLPTNVSFTKASQMIDAIAKNGWRLPESLKVVG